MVADIEPLRSGAATAAGLSELTISADPGKRPSFGRRDLREVGQADPAGNRAPPTGAPTTARSARMFPGRRTDIHRALSWAGRGPTALFPPIPASAIPGNDLPSRLSCNRQIMLRSALKVRAMSASRSPAFRPYFFSTVSEITLSYPE